MEWTDKIVQIFLSSLILHSNNLAISKKTIPWSKTKNSKSSGTTTVKDDTLPKQARQHLQLEKNGNNEKIKLYPNNLTRSLEDNTTDWIDLVGHSTICFISHAWGSQASLLKQTALVSKETIVNNEYTTTVFQSLLYYMCYYLHCQLLWGMFQNIKAFLQLMTNGHSSSTELNHKFYHRKESVMNSHTLI